MIIFWSGISEIILLVPMFFLKLWMSVILQKNVQITFVSAWNIFISVPTIFWLTKYTIYIIFQIIFDYFKFNILIGQDRIAIAYWYNIL